MPIPALVADSDADLAAWQAGTQSFFLEAACAEVRKFCGWHIAPSVTVTDKVCWFGQGDLVMLGSTHVTEISEVTVEGTALTAGCDYTWQEPKGWLRIHPTSLQVAYWPGWEPNALVSFTHGYEETPADVKAVIFEVVATAMELPASNATRFATMQYNFELNPDIGVALSETQKTRLGRYRLRSFGGLVRP
jgi:hypothetical protein